MGFWKRIFKSNIAYFSLDEMLEYAETDVDRYSYILGGLRQARKSLLESGVKLSKMRSIDEFAYWADEVASRSYPSWGISFEELNRRNAMALYLVLSFQVHTGHDMASVARELQRIEFEPDGLR